MKKLRWGTRRLRRFIERPERASLWGQVTIVTPRLIGATFGDGNRLIRIIPLATRPNYFVVRVDSSDEWDVRDVLDDIICAAEDEFGRYDAEEEENGGVEREFPVVDWGIGCHWSERFTLEELIADEKFAERLGMPGGFPGWRRNLDRWSNVRRRKRFAELERIFAPLGKRLRAAAGKGVR